jgi:hypothetical protein
VSEHEYVTAIRADERAKTAGEVLDRVSFKIHSEYTYTGADVLQALGDLRREYAQETKMEKKTTDTIGRLVERIAELPDGRGSEWGTHVHAMVEAHDAAVARAAKVEVLREFDGANVEVWGYSSIDKAMLKRAVKNIAARHGIQPHELEPEKKYAVGDIKVVDVRRVGIVIGCGDKTWDGDGWTDQSIQNYSMKDAEAIAARLRADGNVPGGGK